MIISLLISFESEIEFSSTINEPFISSDDLMKELDILVTLLEPLYPTSLSPSYLLLWSNFLKLHIQMNIVKNFILC